MKSYTLLDARLQFTCVHWSQTLHAFSALVSFGSDEMCHFHEEQIRSLQAVCMVGGHEWRLASCCRLFVAPAVLIECRKSRVLYAMKSKSAVRKKFTWTADMSADRKSSSLCY